MRAIHSLRAGRISGAIGCRLLCTWPIALLLLAVSGNADATRVALVIGNGAYDPSGVWSPLSQPPADAEAVADVLRDGLGFELVLVYRDLGRHQMFEALDRFERALAPGDTALFFYSGHGAHVGDNFLIPIDAGDPISARRLRSQTLPLDEVLGALRAKRTGLNVVVLDACRDNPLARQGKGFGGAGLKDVERADLAGETLIAFAAAPNRKALSGSERLSPYTDALVAELAEPQHLWKMFGAVSERVQRATGGRQEPWIESNLTAERFLASPASSGDKGGHAVVPRAMGHLQVFADVTGEILLDGEYAGDVSPDEPLRLTDLAVDIHKVELRVGGEVVATEEVSIEPGLWVERQLLVRERMLAHERINEMLVEIEAQNTLLTEQIGLLDEEIRETEDSGIALEREMLALSVKMREVKQAAAERERLLGLTSAQRSEITVWLNRMGYDAGRPTGLLDRQAREAIESWQRDCGKDPTGFLDSGDYDALRSVAASAR